MKKKKQVLDLLSVIIIIADKIIKYVWLLVIRMWVNQQLKSTFNL